jgi:hypothetical protein
MQQNMATRINIMKLVQEIEGMAQITNRRLQPRGPGPLMLQFRSPGVRAASARARHYFIRVDFREPQDIPHRVRITHLKR